MRQCERRENSTDLFNRALYTFFVLSMSLWNTMMGTSLLAMPWGILVSGLVLGPFIALAMGVASCYTAILILFLHDEKRKHLENMNLTSANGVEPII